MNRYQGLPYFKVLILTPILRTLKILKCQKPKKIQSLNRILPDFIKKGSVIPTTTSTHNQLQTLLRDMNMSMLFRVLSYLDDSLCFIAVRKHPTIMIL